MRPSLLIFFLLIPLFTSAEDPCLFRGKVTIEGKEAAQIVIAAW